MSYVSNYTKVGAVDESTMGRERHPYGPLSTILISIPIGGIICVIVFGNTLVIVAMLRDSHLKRQSQNWLIVSLALADLLVGLLIMPLTLAYELLDEWTLGGVLCELWLALDVLFVTASILNLVAISLDRYWALTLPTVYPQQRTPRRMFGMIVVVWLSAFAISFPPLVGWRPEGRTAEDCFLSDQLGYVLYSAFGSFYIPVFVLLFVYARIYCISRRRKKKSSVSSMVALPNNNPNGMLAMIDRLRKMGSQRRRKMGTCQKSKDKLSTVQRAGSKEDLLASAPAANPISVYSPVPGDDYATVIAKVRAMAIRRENSAPATVNRKVTTVSAQADSDIISGGEISSSGDGLNRVMAIAYAAAAYSRQESLSDSLTSRTYELQRQLRQRRKLVRRRERQATMVLGLVLGSFVISWLPFFFSYLLSAVCCRTPDTLFDIIFWLGYCNSALNPFLYTYNRDFRRAFRRLLCGPRNGRLSFMTTFNDRLTRGRESIRRTDKEGQHRRVLGHFSSLDNEEG